jgi:hypothetical protein
VSPVHSIVIFCAAVQHAEPATHTFGCVVQDALLVHGNDLFKLDLACTGLNSPRRVTTVLDLPLKQQLAPTLPS